MAENITTLLEKWQKQQQDHPEWTPALEDVFYLNHGTARDRDRIYSLEEVRDLLQTVFTRIMLGTGSKHMALGDYGLAISEGSEHSALTKNSLTFAYGQAGELKEGHIVFNSDGTITIDCNLGVQGLLVNGIAKFLQGLDVTGDVNASGDLSATGKVVSSGKEVNSYGNTVPSEGSYFKLAEDDFIIASAPGPGGRIVFRVQLNGNAYDVIGVGALSANRVVSDVHAVGSGWEVAKSGDSLAFQKVGSGGTATAVARFIGNDLEMLEGYIRGKNTILATSNVDLTSSAYSSIAAGTELTVVNNGSSTISVTYASGATAENIAASSARKYVKKTSGFAKLLALDPTATHS